MAPQKRLYRRIVALLLCLLLSGSMVRGAWSLTVDEEKKWGKQIINQMEGKIPRIRDLTLQSYIDRIGYSLVAQIGATSFEYKFYMIKAGDPNAFALPGGHIFVTTGLITMAENEQELAAVIGHEISHVTSRHISQIMEKGKALSLASLAAMVAGILIGRGGVASGAMVTTAMAGAEALGLKYTREMETEADQKGLQCMIRAGYDPNGMVSFFNKLQKYSMVSAPHIPTYLSTHPATEDRITLLENLLQTGKRPTGPFKTAGNFKLIQVKAFVEERETQVAVSNFQSLVDSRSGGLDSYYGLGLAYRKLGRMDKSIESFQRASLIDPRNPDVPRELGISLFLSGKLDQAIESLEESARLSSATEQESDLLNLFYLGRGYQEKGDFDRALPLFLKVKKEVPDFPDVYFHLGSVYGRTGQKGLSHVYFGKHFKYKGDGRNALLHFRTALEWLERGSPDRDEVQQEIRELTAPPPKTP
jgi:beta-barrel assembly-enhancing protease